MGEAAPRLDGAPLARARDFEASVVASLGADVRWAEFRPKGLAPLVAGGLPATDPFGTTGVDAVVLHSTGTDEATLKDAFGSLREGGLVVLTAAKPDEDAAFPRLHAPAESGIGADRPERLLEDFGFEPVRLVETTDSTGSGYVTAVGRKPEHAEIAAAFAASARVKRRVGATMAADVAAAVDLVVDAIASGGRVLACGNGGSAADAQHFAAEFVGRFLLERPAFAAIALTPDSSIMTAVGNDYGFETVFARQVEAYGRAGDVFVGISTSGTSKNVVLAAERAKAVGLSVVGLTGEKGRTGPLADLSDVLLAVPSTETPRIQESHIAILHAICERAEVRLVR